MRFFCSATIWLSAAGFTLTASCLPIDAAFAQAAPPPSTLPVPAKAAGPQTPSAEALKQWRATMVRASRPRGGCFKVTYPSTEWQPVPCGTPPHKPHFPGEDFTAHFNGNISQAEGSFTNVTGVTSVTSGGNANAYSLQLNTSPINTQACQSSPDPQNCYGLEQFLYDTDGNSGNAYMEYWLKDYGPPGTQCPPPNVADCSSGVQPNGWCPFTNNNQVDCVIQSRNSATVGAVPITSLDQLKLRGGIDATTGDWITITTPGNVMDTVPGDNYFPELAVDQWYITEFNILGECCEETADFNSGSSLTVSISLIGTTGELPSCAEETFSAESNNLILTTPVTTSSVPSPTLEFDESNSFGTVKASCPGVSVGDTHIKTFLITHDPQLI